MKAKSKDTSVTRARAGGGRVTVRLEVRDTARQLRSVLYATGRVWAFSSSERGAVGGS